MTRTAPTAQAEYQTPEAYSPPTLTSSPVAESVAKGLSDKHRQMLEESGIAATVATERGYETATRRSDLPDAFSKGYQRRAPALVVPMYSPDGKTTGAQIRPDRPRLDKKGKAIKYETAGGSRIVIDVHPRSVAAVGDPGVDLFVTEGVKKGDALASRGECAISLIGVWNWQKGGELLPCWDHVALKGRRVYVVFDSDAMTKEGVQIALERLVRALEGRGADVRVVYLPDGEDGSKTGVDDYLAAGGNVAELRALARRFEVEDLGRIRLSRDDRLRAAVEALRSRWWGFAWDRLVGTGARPHTWRGHTCRDVMKVLIDRAAKSGVAVEDGIAMKAATRTIALDAATSRPTVMKALSHLEADGMLRRVKGDRAADEAGRYVLLTGRASVVQKGSKGGEEGERVTTPAEGYDPGGKDLRAPRLRWSDHGRKARAGVVKESSRVREMKTGDRPARSRLGKIRAAVIDHLDAAGGALDLDELYDALHPDRLPEKRRPRDLRRRQLPMLEEAGIITVADDGIVALTPDWTEALHNAREIGGEIEAEELQRERHREQSEGFRNRRKAPTSQPSAAGTAAIERSRQKRARHLAEHEAHQAKADASEIEHRGFVKRIVHDRVKSLGHIRLELLQEVLKDAGGTPGYALPAAKSLGCTVEEWPEYPGEVFILAPASWRAA